MSALATTTTTNNAEEAKPKLSEPIVRRLWAMAHRVVEPRSLGWALRKWSAFNECVVAYELREKRIALTIDDVPSEVGLMERMLDVLCEHGVRATLFVVEEFAAEPERREVLRRALAQGHELANHLVRDESPANYSPAEFSEALERCDRLIASLDPGWSEHRPKWYRPPHGFMNEYMKGHLKEKGYVAALADVFPLDTEVRSVDWLVDFVKSHVKPGSIVLLHAPDVRDAKNGKHHKRQNNIQVLQQLIPDLKAMGFEISTLTDLHHAFHRTQQEDQLELLANPLEDADDDRDDVDALVTLPDDDLGDVPVNADSNHRTSALL
ncbi:hypothetical protein CTAYLR_004608 [Chrysophaeum taylorii]|uniref:NodB homology domain-containing protein n=1 Tax=Chrysophaeum taylorii TaxID=2483200 RepID=A0AAD7UFG7_9STRA|nr:hypothetical protein CTAYLR_004608 [Chrysophaeum taylorii]